jgi:hypothetical protein
MRKSLDKLTVKLCESLPLNFTIYEHNGLCMKPNETCNYCRRNEDNSYFCYKKTYTPNKKLGMKALLS